MKYDSIFLFAIPSTLLTGHFNQYFIENTKNLYLFLIPLSHQEPQVKCFHYQYGKKIKKYLFFIYKGNNRLIKFIFLYLYYIYMIFFILPKKTIIFATTPQYCFLNSIFKLFKQITIVYQINDYYPNQKGLMRIYQALVHFYNKRIKYVIYNSPEIEKKLQTDKHHKNGKRECVVWGIENKIIEKGVHKNLLGFVGVLRPGQGVEIILETLEKNKKLKLEIIGDGPYAKTLKLLVKKLSLNKRVKFWGLIENEKAILSIVKRWEIGVAPYNPSVDNMSFFGEPSKTKFYLEYKLPVIMTKITYMQQDLYNYQAGECVEYNSQSILEAIHKIQKDYKKYIEGVKKLVAKYEYKSYYDKKFKFLATMDY